MALPPPNTEAWLDIAQSELGVLSSQCVSRRIPDKPTLEKEVAAWEDHRNKHHAEANWQFTTDDARVKLRGSTPHFEIGSGGWLRSAEVLTV